MRRSETSSGGETPQCSVAPGDNVRLIPTAEGSVNHANLGELTGHLLRLAHLAAQREFATAFPGGEVTSLQYGALELIGANPGIGHGQLADELHTSKTVLTTSLKALLASETISQRRGQSDSRLACYRLTGEGEALRAGLRRKVAASEAALALRLGEGDARELKRLLRRVVGFPKTSTAG